MNVRVFTGSRKTSPYLDELDKALDGADLVLVGCCRTGTDAAVLRRAREREIDVRIYAAKWKATIPTGRAGPDRNGRIAVDAAALKAAGHRVRCFAYPKGKSRGTRGCARLLERLGLRVITVELP